MLKIISLLVAIAIKRLMIRRSKCHQKNLPMVCDSFVKYEEAEVDRSVVILKITAAADCVENSKQPASTRAA